MRITITGTRLTIGCAALTIVASLSVSACSGSLPAQNLPSTTPSSLSPSGGAATTPAEAASGSTPSATASASPSASPGHSDSPVVTAAPATGGGGTAGFRDGPLLGLGAAAIVAGAGSIAYRRRVMRNH
jgi:hypothetical protein